MDDLGLIFEEQHTHLRTVTYRLLGSVREADDAVQEIARVRMWLPALAEPAGAATLRPSGTARSYQYCSPRRAGRNACARVSAQF
jgi:hypothetical protein